jgi:hypothetical protein
LKSELLRFQDENFMDLTAFMSLEYIADIQWASNRLGAPVYVLLRGLPNEELLWKHYGGSGWVMLGKAERSDVVSRQEGVFISQRSTLCLDALGAGRRALFHQIWFETSSHDSQIDAWWWLQGATRIELHQRLSEILHQTDEDFQSNHHHTISQFTANGMESENWRRLESQIANNAVQLGEVRKEV